MKKTKLLYSTIIFTILLILVSTYSYAAEITKETLKGFFDIFKDPKTGTQLIQVTDNKIIGDLETTKLDIEYELTDRPTFKIESIFENGMTCEECADEAKKFIYLMYAFTAICNKDINDFNATNKYFTDKVTQNSSYIEYTNTVISKENFTNTKDYVEKRFAKDIIVDDELFSLSVKKESMGNGEYKVLSQLIVNTDKDFSIINGNTTEGKDNITQTSTPLPTKTPSTANIGTMPNAGFELNALNILKVVLGLSISALIVYSIYNKRYNSK